MHVKGDTVMVTMTINMLRIEIQTDDNEGCDDATVPWMYREARDELLDVGFRQSLNIETRPHYTMANYLFQPNPFFPLDCRYHF